MKGKQIAILAPICILIAVLAYYFTIVFAPYSILIFLQTKNGLENNVPVYPDIITEKDREVVMPNPDFLYVVTPFDVSEGPVKVSGKMPDSTYYSVAFYTSNTRNFFIKNDRETPEKAFEVVLGKARDLEFEDSGIVEKIEAPSQTGAILVRMLIRENADIQSLKEIQHSFKVQKLE